MGNWMKEDGERLAELIYTQLKDNGELSFHNMISIYDSLTFPIFRKAELYTWKILDSKKDIEYFNDSQGRKCLRHITPQREEEIRLEQVVEMEFTVAELEIIAKGLLVLNATKWTVDDNLTDLLNKVYKAKMPKDN